MYRCLCGWKFQLVWVDISGSALVGSCGYTFCCCSVAWSCLTLCDPAGCSTPGFPVLHCLPDFAQTHVHWLVPGGILAVRSGACLWVAVSLCLSSLECVSLSSGVSVATCMAILHVGSAQQVRTGSTSSKEEDYESDAATIVQKCVSPAAGDGEPCVFSRGNMAASALLLTRGKGKECSPYPSALSGRPERKAPACLFGSWLAVQEALRLCGGGELCER